MVEFLERFEWPESVTLNLFLTNRSGVELAWEEEPDGLPVQLEFHRNGIEVYREATGTETELALGDVNRVVGLLE